MKPPPPMPELSGSTTLRANWIAAAASTALPPSCRTLAPTSAARGLETETTPLVKPFCSTFGGAPGVGKGGSAQLGADSTTSASRIALCAQFPNAYFVRSPTIDLLSSGDARTSTKQAFASACEHFVLRYQCRPSCAPQESIFR